MPHKLSRLATTQKKEFYSQELFDGYTLLKRYLRLLIIFIGVCELARSFLFTSYRVAPALSTYQSMTIYASSTLGSLCYVISTLQCIDKINPKGISLRSILSMLSNFGLSLAVFVRTIWEVDVVLQNQSAEAWLDLLTLLTTLTFGIVLADVIFPIWYLKTILPLSMFAGLMVVTLSKFPSNWPTLIGRIVTSGLYIVFLTLLKDKFRWKIFEKRMEDESWKSIQTKILDEIPTSIVIMDIKEEKVVYSNQEFLKLSENATPEDFLKRVSHITCRKEKDHFFKSSPFDLDNESLHQSINMEVSPGISYRKRSADNDEILVGDILIPNESLPPLPESLYHVLKIFCVKYKNMKNASFLEVYDGSFKNSQGISLSFEAKLTCTGENPKLILMINETTQRDIIVSLRSNNKYKDNLLATISHELRTPLNGSLALLETAISQQEETSDLRKLFLEPALKSGRLLVHIINDILDYSQLNTNSISLALQDLSIIRTIKDCYDLTELQIKKKNLTYTFLTQNVIPATFVTDHPRVKQVLLNLLSNAIKFTFEGEIKIEAKMIEPDVLKISVSDTGIGMKPEEKTKLFHNCVAVYTGEKVTENSTGVGLGLTVANKLAKLLGPPEGHGLMIESEYGKGSTFSFCVQHKVYKKNTSAGIESFEVSKDPLLRIDNMITSFDEFPDHSSPAFLLNNGRKYTFSHFIKDSGVALRNPTSPFLIRESTFREKKSVSIPKGCDVLIVDDDPFNILALEALLKPFEVRIDTAYNGKEAVEKIKKKNEITTEGGQNYKLVLMDFNMPIMNGHEATKILTEMMDQGSLEKIKIVGCTAYNTKKDINTGLQSGMVEVITKPVVKDILEAVLKRHIGI